MSSSCWFTHEYNLYLWPLFLLLYLCTMGIKLFMIECQSKIYTVLHQCMFSITSFPNFPPTFLPACFWEDILLFPLSSSSLSLPFPLLNWFSFAYLFFLAFFLITRPAQSQPERLGNLPLCPYTSYNIMDLKRIKFCKRKQTKRLDSIWLFQKKLRTYKPSGLHSFGCNKNNR